MNKLTLTVSKIVSLFFSPFIITFWAFLFAWYHLFIQTNLMDVAYKVYIFNNAYVLTTSYRNYLLTVVLLFTLIIPALSIHLFRHLNQWTSHQIGQRERRSIPYVLTLLSYVTCYFLLAQSNTWVFFRSIILAAIAAIVLCFIINLWWKISTHMVGMGSLVGMLVAFSVTFRYNPLYIFSLLLLVSGIVGTARMILRQHSLAQVCTGFLLGAVTSFLAIFFRGELI